MVEMTFNSLKGFLEAMSSIEGVRIEEIKEPNRFHYHFALKGDKCVGVFGEGKRHYGSDYTELYLKVKNR